MSGRNSMKWLTIPWSILLAVGVIALAGSVMLPSTKRARVDWDEVRRQQTRDAEAAATQPATTMPATAPAAATDE